MTMSHSPPVALRALLAAAVVGLALETQVAAQYGRSLDRYPPEWESDRFRVRRLSIEPRAQLTEPDAADGVLVFLTADLDGRMPPAEAVWQRGGQRTLENRGKVRFEGILIELKDAPPGSVKVTPPEAIASTDRVDVWGLIDNERVLVTKHRYAPVTIVDPPHFHPQDTLVLYLKGGYTWPALEQPRGWYAWPISIFSWSPAYRVNRGDVDVVPANTLHAFSNAGGDPLEFLVIVPK
jgi:hypothetical protein